MILVCSHRCTYLEPNVERSYQSVIPSRSIHKIHDHKRLRVRQAKPKLFLCSMCKTHCFDTDNSDIENSAHPPERKQTTPALKISYKNASGQSIMDFVPQKPAKSSHKRKHKSKHKKSKKPRHDVEEGSEETQRAENSQHTTTSSGFESITNLKHDSSSESDSKLVIDLPEESKPKPAVAPAASHQKPEKGQKSRRVKTTKTRMIAKSENNSDIVSSKNVRNVSTYEGSDGKIISVGDVIWGKIIGFPWWPGRVCAIAVMETEDGIICDYVADIDWYCSPTKSHLSCSLIYPFLEDFEKR